MKKECTIVLAPAKGPILKRQLILSNSKNSNPGILKRSVFQNMSLLCAELWEGQYLNVMDPEGKVIASTNKALKLPRPDGAFIDQVYVPRFNAKTPIERVSVEIIDGEVLINETGSVTIEVW